MGRVGTEYDKELNEKVYVVKGDEGYVHTTEILLTQTGTITQGTSTYTVPFIITTHRNRGDSTITVYDNKEVIAILDCDTANDTISYSATLEYNVSHNIYVRYNGNKLCLPSKSFMWSDVRENPNLSVTTLTQSGSLRFNNTDTASTTVTVSEESGSISVSGLTLYYAVDGGTLQSATTNSSGEATISMGTLTNGIHNVSVFYDGSSSLTSASIEFQAIVGYSVEIIEYPPAFTNILDWSYDNIVKVQVLDYLGEPVSGGTVSFNSTNETTDSNGIATFSITNGTGGSYYATYGNYTSDTVAITEANVTSITLTQSNQVENGLSTDLTWKLNGTGDFSGVYLRLSLSQSNVEFYSTSKYTDENGEITITYDGTGRGRMNARIGISNDDYESETIEDYTQYWKSPNESRNRSSYASYCALQSVSNGWKVKASSGIHRGAMTFTNLPIKFDFMFKVKSVGNASGLRINNKDYQFKANQNVRLRQDGTSGSLYINDTLISATTSESSGTIKLWVNYNQSTADSWITFDNLRVLKL